MTTLTVAPMADYAEGTTTVNEFALADSVTKFMLSIARNTPADLTVWPLSTVSFQAVFDFFDGAQWIVGLFGISDSGGLRISHGVATPASYGIWPFPTGAGRKLRGAVTITGGTLRSSVTVDVT